MVGREKQKFLVLFFLYLFRALFLEDHQTNCLPEGLDLSLSVLDEIMRYFLKRLPIHFLIVINIFFAVIGRDQIEIFGVEESWER